LIMTAVDYCVYPATGKWIGSYLFSRNAFPV
jgi:hypothetical protein